MSITDLTKETSITLNADFKILLPKCRVCLHKRTTFNLDLEVRLT